MSEQATTDSKRVVERAFAELANGDSGALMAILAEDVRWTLAGRSKWSGTYEGKRALRRELLAPIYARFADRYQTEVGRVIAEGDHVVVENRGWATTKAGASYDNTSCYLLRLEAGEVVEVTEYCDTQLVAEALGDPRGSQLAPDETELPLERSQEFTVEGWLLTDVGGTIHGEVLSTSAMIRMMELNCMALVAERLGEGRTTVGFEVRARHLAAAAKGSTCVAHGRLREVVGDRSFHFDVEVHEGGRTIGTGTHERRAVEARRRAAA